MVSVEQRVGTTAPHKSSPAFRAERPLRLVYLVTEDWYFLMHRLPMARAAKAAGYEVHVATRVNDVRGREAIEAEGFVLHPIDLGRGSRRPDRVLAAVKAVRVRYRAICPDIVHHVALQSAIIGSLAATGLKIPAVNALTGLGTVFTSGTGAVIPRLVRAVFPRLVNRGGAVATVENPDDGALLHGLGVARERIVHIPGSGVDIDRLTPMAEPDEPVVFAYGGRMLEIKGVRTLMAAHRLVRDEAGMPRLVLAGSTDPHNPTSLSEAQMRAFAAEPGVSWLGHVDDIRSVWAKAHVAVLVSRGGEGVPVSLLEAAACGRPLIASDVPGCREIALPGVNALRVAPDDPVALAGAMRQLAGDPELRRRLAANSRRIVEERFESRLIGREIVALYDRMLGVRRG